MPSEFNSIPEALASLGSTPERVYQTLKMRGIKGKRGLRCQCPVARYLTQTVGAPCDVSTIIAAYDYTAAYNYTLNGWTYLPEAVRQFVERFDFEQDYQDLLET